MSIPLPPQDAAGGIMVVSYGAGSPAHRFRVHVASQLNPDGTYQAAPPLFGGAREASAQATFTALCTILAGLYPAAWSFNLAALYTVANNVATQLFGWTPPAGVPGTNAGAVTPKEVYRSLNFRTTHGGRARIFLFQAVGASPPYVLTAGTGQPNPANPTSNYISGSATMICGHDGYPLTNYIHYVDGMNRKLRRRQGDA